MKSGTELISVRTILLSSDIRTKEILCNVAQRMTIHIVTCCDAEVAIRKLCRSKFEGIIVDLAFDGGLEFLQKLRSTTSNRSAICYAILRRTLEQTQAFQAGANFVFEHPLSQASAMRVLQASYSLMVRERRRYFRYPLEASVRVKRGGDSEFEVSSLNLSETGLCLNSSQSMQVGDKLQLRLVLPGDTDALSLDAEVCWNQASGKVGVQFCNIAPKVDRALRTWLAERLEDTLARQLGTEMAQALTL